ncbi:MAG: phage/plasmid primase, P4 family [Candidatus Metalachnospira sp.]|nr:phage/plasmid primase, P4 family [Candidatus Metalachnospira sp.]
MFEKIPEELKQQGKFCLWKYELDNNGRRTKVPYKTNGLHADAADERTFTTFENVIKVYLNSKDYDGIGIGAFGNIDFIDVDDCIDKGRMSRIAHAITEVMDSYTEISPSGNGVRIIFHTKNFVYDKKKYYINNRKNKLEVYIAGATKRFCTITGNVIRERELEFRNDELQKVLDTYMVRPISKKKNKSDPPGSFLSDDSVIDIASHSAQKDKFLALWNGIIPDGKSQSEADMALAMILAFYCGGDIEQMDRLFRRCALMRDKWDRIQSGSTYGKLTLEKAVAEVSDFYKPFIVAADDDFDDIFNKLLELHPVDNSRYKLHDTGFGRLFADIYHSIARYVPERKMWFVYDGIRWVQDVGNLKTMELAKSLGDSLLKYTSTIQDEGSRIEYFKRCMNWQKRGYRATYIADAQSVHPISMAEFDSNIYYLNCKNVTVDMRTGETHEHSPEDLIIKLANVTYDPTAISTRFLTFVDEVMSSDKEKAKFLQKAKGYGLTGDTSYECMFIEHGATTRNGKGTLNESCLRVAGDYGLSVQPETIAAKHTANSQAPSEDIARLAGIRYANISEPRRGLVLNEALVKSMTGNDTLNARFLHENSFDFHPQFKIFMNTNYLPVITDMTLFTSGRIFIIPYDRHFEEWEQDKTLKREFTKEKGKSAILNWMMEGYQTLLQEGLNPPQCVKDATKAYAHESDKITLFKEDCLELNQGHEEKTASVYNEYKSWCSQNGCYPENSRNFNQALKTFGEVVRRRPKSGGEKTTLLVGYKLITSDFLC